MFGFYAYGISLGMDIRDLAKIINTPQGRAISKLCEGNVVNGQMGAFSALQAIKKLEGENIFGDLTQFDLKGEMKVDSNNTVSGGIVFDNKVKYTASQVMQELMKDWYIKNIAENSNSISELIKKPNVKRKRGQIDTSTDLTNMIYQISILGRMRECMESIYNKNNPLWNEVTSQSTQYLENKQAWMASMYQLKDYLNKYGNLVYTYYNHTDDAHYLARDLKILGQGAEEMRVLGSILSSNKGVKSRTEEGIIFIDTIENAIIDRKRIMGIDPDPEDKIDFILFCVDPNYRQQAIDKYEEVKHTTNILDVVATAPHFRSYLRACSVPYAAFKMGSSKFRARDRYYKPVSDALAITKSSDKEGVIRGIEAAVNNRMLREWLSKNQSKFILPKGNKLFVGRDQDMLTVQEDTVVPLWTENGLATFKYYMEQAIIPNLRQNPNYANNSFVHGLTPFELTKTGTHAAVTAYTLDGNMLPYTESQTVQMETYKADFSQMYDYAFPGSNRNNSIPSYADAMYLYSQYVFGGKKGQRSLMSLFDDGECSLAQDFESYEAWIDRNKDFEFDIQDLIKWCAPNGNIYNPNSEYFYGTSTTDFGHQFYRKAHEETSKRGNNPDEAGINPDEVSKKSKKQTADYIGDPITDIGKQMYLNPVTSDLPMQEAIFGKGLNANLANYNQFLDVELEPGTGETWSLVSNFESGTYSLQPTSVMSPRGQQILDLANKNLELVEISIPSLDRGAYIKGINPEALKALIEESINEIDHNCGK